MDTPETGNRPPTRFWRGFVRGMLAGAGGIGMAAFLVSYAMVTSFHKVKTSGWNLVPVVIADSDIDAGAAIDVDLVSVHDVPEQFVTRSVIRPDNVSHIFGKRTVYPVKRNDMLRWSDFQVPLFCQELMKKQDSGDSAGDVIH